MVSFKRGPNDTTRPDTREILESLKYVFLLQRNECIGGEVPSPFVVALECEQGCIPLHREGVLRRRAPVFIAIVNDDATFHDGGRTFSHPMVGVYGKVERGARGGPYGACGGTEVAPNSPALCPTVVVQGKVMLIA